MVFKPALNLTEQIADGLAQQIIHGQLRGLDRIQELKIAKDLAVSRGSVREALLILERRHLIEIVPRRGAVVNAIGREDAIALVELLAAAERYWFLGVISAHKNNSLQTISNVQPSIEGMEAAARHNSVFDLVVCRGEYYLAMLSGATKYTQAVFECLLPSSQVVLNQLLARGTVDGHDVARYYRALHTALLARDAERLDELLNAFRRRLHRLCSQALTTIPQQALPDSVQRWHARVEVGQELV